MPSHQAPTGNAVHSEEVFIQSTQANENAHSTMWMCVHMQMIGYYSGSVVLKSVIWLCGNSIYHDTILRPSPISYFYLNPLFSSATLPLRAELQVVMIEIFPCETDNPSRPWYDISVVIIEDGIYISRSKFGGNGIIILTFAIYLMEIEEHGFSRFIHNLSLSSYKTEWCFITRPLVVLRRLMLAADVSTLPVCTIIREAVTGAATSLLDFS